MTPLALISELGNGHRRRRVWPWMVLAAGIGLLAGGVDAEPPVPGLLQQFEREVTALHVRARGAVVKIHSEQEVSLGGLRLAPYHRVGTGFFVSSNGLLVTAATVVAGADRCWIEYAGRRLAARPCGLDRRANLAVLAVDPAGCVPGGQPLPHLPLTGSATPPAIGSFVVAVGFAYDLPCAPSVGVVQGLDLVHGTNVLVTSHLRTDCRLKPGQAGAPLLGTDGQVVAIAVAARGDDQCYALPAGAARRVVDDLVDHGATQYSWVGLEVVERRPALATDELRDPLLLIQEVCTNSPASLAGFQPEDQLVQIQRRPVRGLADVIDMVFHHRAGDELAFTVRRRGELHELRVVLGAAPSPTREDRPAPSLRLTPVDAPR